MRRLVLSAVLFAGLVAAPAAFADDAAPAPADAAKPAKPAKPAKDDPNRIVCTREHVVGSNRPQKVCMTWAQREEIRERAQGNMNRGIELSPPPITFGTAGS